MDGEDLGSSSDLSSGDELCQQLRDAGLLVGRKLRQHSFADETKKGETRYLSVFNFFLRITCYNLGTNVYISGNNIYLLLISF